MSGGPPLFGAETEFAFTPLGPTGERVHREPALERFFAMARASLPHLRDAAGSGVFLENASRFYIDAGLHPELSTPECADPWSLVRYILAGERILAGLATAFEAADHHVGKALFFKCNVDYSGSESTWGCHESYLHTVEPRLLPRQIIPHLVSRVVFAGAGGFNPLSPGLEFTLSPRASHIDHLSSSGSTERRGIIHTKDEPLAARGYHRLHLICGESLCSETAMWLKAGTTALVVGLADAGVRPGEAVQLASPVDALRSFAADPRCRVSAPLAGGGSATAIEIQTHYLAQVEAHLDLAVMPSWAPAVCRLWRNILELLAGAPDSASGVLDWGLKHALYADRARRHAIAWDSLRHWTAAVSRIRRALGLPVRSRDLVPLEQLLDTRSPRVVRRVDKFLRGRGLAVENLGAFLALRRELFEADTRFGQLGEGGVFATLDRAGVLRHHVSGIDGVSEARTKPPPGGRARLRGEAVRRLASRKERYLCNWDAVWDLEDRRLLDLREPFETREHWRPLDNGEAEWLGAAPSRVLQQMVWDRGAHASVRQRDREAEVAVTAPDRRAEAAGTERDREAEAAAREWVEEARRSRGL